MSLLDEDFNANLTIKQLADSCINIVGREFFGWAQFSSFNTGHVKQRIADVIDTLTDDQLDPVHIVPALDNWINYNYRKYFKWRDISKYEKRYTWKKSKYSHPVGFVIKIIPKS